MPLAVSIENMEAEVRRELGFRARVYARWIQQRKIRPEKAAEQTERMQALLEALEELRLARAFKTAFDQPSNQLVLSNPATDPWLTWCAFRGVLTHGQHARPAVAP